MFYIEMMLKKQNEKSQNKGKLFQNSIVTIEKF